MKRYTLILLICIILLAAIPWIVANFSLHPLLPTQLEEEREQYETRVAEAQQATLEAQRAATNIPPNSTLVSTVIPTVTNLLPTTTAVFLVPPEPPPSDVVEIESPPELLVGQSDTIRITLRRTNLISYTPTLEIINNNLVTDVIQPVATPKMPLDLAFGEKYQLFAAAKLVAPDIQIEPVSPSIQPYDTDIVTWLFSVSGKKPGNHKITASLTIRWLTKSSSASISSDKVNDNIERQVWRSSIPIEVTEPILRVGTYTIGEIWTYVGGGGLVGAMLGWFANDMKDKTSNRSNRQGRRKKQ